MSRFRVAALADLSEDELTKVEVGGMALVLGLVDGVPYAMDARCSHMGYDLSKGRKEGHIVRCKLHGAEFDMRTGEVLKNMQAKTMRTYPLIVEGGEILIEL